MRATDRSSIYLSIFKRKGGESLNTKIVNEDNKNDYGNLFSQLEAHEKPLLIYFVNMLNWVLLTNSRVLKSEEGITTFLCLIDIVEIRPALHEEIKDRIFNKKKFTRLKIKTIDGGFFILDWESGQAYEGVYQVLHFIADTNANN